jgi:hypothetical protein
MKIFNCKAKGHWRPDFDYRDIWFGDFCCELMKDAVETYHWIRWNWEKHIVSIPVPCSPDEDEDFPIKFCPWCGDSIQVYEKVDEITLDEQKDV